MQHALFCKIIIFALIFNSFVLFPMPCFAVEVTPKVVRLGDISKEQITKQSLEIKNNESQTIVLEKARTSCECVKMEYEKEEQIQKGSTYTIILDIDTGDLPSGKFKKFIFLYFKNSKTPIVSVEIKGNLI